MTAEERDEGWARLLLGRFGVVSRELSTGGDWARLRHALTRMEFAGEAVRGYFVQGLSGEQYALEAAVEQLRGGSRKQEPALLLNSYQALFNRPPALRPVRRIEVRTWDGAPVRASEAAAPLLAAGFYPDGPRLLWDGYPGARPRS